MKLHCSKVATTKGSNNCCGPWFQNEVWGALGFGACGLYSAAAAAGPADSL